MSATSHAQEREISVASSQFVVELAWSIVLLPLVVFAWHESNFQYDVYMPADYGGIFNSLSIAAVVILGAVSWSKGYPRTFVRVAVGYIALGGG